MDNQRVQLRNRTITRDTDTAAMSAEGPEAGPMELIATTITFWQRVSLFIGITIVVFVYSLENNIHTSLYQPVAASDLKKHANIGVINAVTFVLGATFQPMIARASKVFGRFHLMVMSGVLYVIGLAIETVSHTMRVYCFGNVIYHLGFITIVLVVELIIADITSLRTRVLGSYIPTIPFLVSAVFGGNVATSSLKSMGWRWSIGIWTWIYPVALFSLAAIFLHVVRSSMDQGHHQSANRETASPVLGRGAFARSVFWRLDVIGTLLLSIALSCILAPFANSNMTSDEAAPRAAVGILVPVLLGVLASVVFIYQQVRFAQDPLIPFKLLADRAIWSPLGIGLTFNMVYNLQWTFLVTSVMMVWDATPDNSVRLANIYGFVSVIVGPLVGLWIYKGHNLKPLVIAGTIIYAAGPAIMVGFNHHGGDGGHYALAIGQALLGIGGGILPYPTMASIQAAVEQKDVAIISGLYLATYRTGAAIGNALAGIIWTHVVNRILFMKQYKEWAHFAYQQPLPFVQKHKMGSPERLIMATIYNRALLIVNCTGLGICTLLLGFAIFFRNPVMGGHPAAVEEIELGNQPTGRSLGSAPEASPSQPSLAHGSLEESAAVEPSTPL